MLDQKQTLRKVAAIVAKVTAAVTEETKVEEQLLPFLHKSKWT
jgi:hypothetical protein